MGISAQDIATIIAALQDSDWDEGVIVIGDARVAVARNGARLHGEAPAPVASAPVASVAPAAAPAAASPPAAASAPESSAPAAGTLVNAPTIGVFWSSPEPGSAPFVEVGAHVEAGDSLCIVEVMKLMTNVTAPAAGTITEVLVGNGENVEFDSPLFRLLED